MRSEKNDNPVELRKVNEDILEPIDTSTEDKSKSEQPMNSSHSVHSHESTEMKVYVHGHYEEPVDGQAISADIPHEHTEVSPISDEHSSEEEKQTKTGLFKTFPQNFTNQEVVNAKEEGTMHEKRQGPHPSLSMHSEKIVINRGAEELQKPEPHQGKIGDFACMVKRFVRNAGAKEVVSGVVVAGAIMTLVILALKKKNNRFNY